MREATRQEYYAIRNYPHVDIRRMHSRSFTDIILSYMGQQVGHCREHYTRRGNLKTTGSEYWVSEDFLDKIQSRRKVLTT